MLALVLAATLLAQPARIISTAPSITEMLYALGLGDRIVGVTMYCHYPPEALKKPKVGTYLRPDLETILSLRPDLVVALKSPVDLTPRLTAMKLRALEVDHEDLAGIYESIRRIGDVTQAADRAGALTVRIQEQLAAIRNRSAPLAKRKIMFIVGRTPGRLEGLVAVGRASYLNELMAIAGGENIFGNTAIAYPKISIEEVLSRDPDVIVDMGDMADTVGVTDEHKRGVAALWKRYPTLKAVQGDGVFAVASDIFVVPGPRAVDAAREFARMLHPAAGF